MGNLISVRCGQCRRRSYLKRDELLSKLRLPADVAEDDFQAAARTRLRCRSCKQKSAVLEFGENHPTRSATSDEVPSGRSGSPPTDSATWYPKKLPRPHTNLAEQILDAKNSPNNQSFQDSAGNEWFSRSDWKKLRGRQMSDLMKRKRE